VLLIAAWFESDAVHARGNQQVVETRAAVSSYFIARVETRAAVSGYFIACKFARRSVSAFSAVLFCKRQQAPARRLLRSSLWQKGRKLEFIVRAGTRVYARAIMPVCTRIINESATSGDLRLDVEVLLASYSHSKADVSGCDPALLG
jgi:hypothetical protein